MAVLAVAEAASIAIHRANGAALVEVVAEFVIVAVVVDFDTESAVEGEVVAVPSSQVAEEGERVTAEASWRYASPQRS